MSIGRGTLLNKTDRYTNKDKLNALKLVRDKERTKYEVLLHGPIDLLAQQLQEQLKEIVETNQIAQRSFFVLPAIERPNENIRLDKCLPILFLTPFISESAPLRVIC